MKSFSTLFNFPIFLISLLFLFSCGGDDFYDSNDSYKEPSYIQVSPNFINLRVNNSRTVEVEKIHKDNSVDVLNNAEVNFILNDNDVASINSKGELKALKEGNTTLVVKYKNLTPLEINVVVSKELNASNLNPVHFGNLYIDNIPNDSTLEKYDERLFAMITGKVSDEHGRPLKDIVVSIHKFGEYGTTKTDENGSYAIPVEGGKNIIIRYSKPGYTTIDRDIYAKVQDWTIAPDVTMLAKDAKVSTIKMSDTNPRIHSSSKINDERGERQATIVFEGVNKAKAIDKDGSERELETINIRATEFKTPPSMPSNLPNTTAFTYCVDITVDGVTDSESVTFDNPLVMYVDNFLGFNVGELVPVGYYDRNKGEWIGSDNGIIVRLLDTNSDGMVDALDANGDGEPDDLNGDGDFGDEVAGISNNTNYQAGKTYQRAKITHFTPWDCNFPYVPEGDVNEPNSDNTDPNTGTPNQPNDNPVCTNSYITSKTQILHEDIDIAGTNVKLHYNSRKTDGFKYIISASIDTSDLPFTALGAQSILEIGGRRFVKDLEFNKINNVEFEWDGKDAVGNKIPGTINGKLITRYSYKLQYMYACAPLSMSSSSPRKISSPLFAESSPNEITCSQTFADVSVAWAQTGKYPSGITGKELIYYDTEQDIMVQTDDLSSEKDNLANGWTLHDDLYMNIHAKGTLSNAVTQKYIELKDGLLFMVDNEPENRFTISKLVSNNYYALIVTFPSSSLGYYGNILNFASFYISDKKSYETNRIPLGQFSQFDFKKNYDNTPKPGHDVFAHYRGTIFEGASEWYLGASVTPWDLKQKIRDMIDSNTHFVFPTNDDWGNLNLRGSYWVFLQPTEFLYRQVDMLYPDYDQTLYKNQNFLFLNLSENDIIIFNDNLGYVYDTSTGLLTKIFDNTVKQIIKTYKHDDNGRLISIADQFDNKLEITRDYNGNPISITAPNGQVTRLSVNYKGDLTSINYEDGSTYIFDYNDNSLMTSKRTPEGHYSSYYYNDKGRVERQTDTNNGQWQFNKAQLSKTTEYSIVKPEGDKLTYVDTRGFDNAISSLIKLPSGYSYSTTFDDNKTSSVVDNVQTTVQTQKDPLTLNTILKSQTVKMPSGLTKTITNDIIYAGDIKNLQSKTQRVTTNSKTVTIKTDYTQGTITALSPNNIKETLTYDQTTSLPLKYQYANLEPVNYEYDNKGRLTKLSQHQNIITYSYNYRGNTQAITDAKGRTTYYEYDLLDRVTSITYPNNIKEYYSYDKEGNVLRYITPKNTNFDFTYNPLSQRTSFKMPSSKTILYSYNKNRDLTKITYPSSKSINYHYDKSQLSKITTSDSDEFIYRYSFHNKIDTITRNNQEKTSYTYDGELMTKISQEGVLNQDISFTYNNDFLPNSITYLNKQDVYSYNNDNQIVKVNNIDINRDSTNGFITSIDNGVFKKEFDYDTKGYISNIKDNSYEQTILSRYDNNNIKEIKEINSNIISTYKYEYDNLNRLTKVIKDNQITEQYKYDNQGNRIKAIINNQEITASYNSDDELISYGNNQYSYNKDGQLISQQNTQGVTSYNYDIFGNLKEVILPN
ncbi:MAG: hypothetical protein LBG21_04440, partial [Campylobacteraceae bacterium]|nr:hypothetical protein [Campylobacteraceae bacterium]